QLAMQAPALLTREFFNFLSHGAQAQFDLWALVALMVAAGLAEGSVRYGLIFSRVTFHFSGLALMRKNVFSYVLNQPGARPMPTSPGESISRFGGDLDEIGRFFQWLEMLFGHAISTVVAIAFMVSINPLITLVAFAPLVLVAVAASVTMSQVQRYREVYRRTSARVIGFVAETFGAVQTIKVATAENTVLEEFNRLNDDRRKAALKD